MYDSEDYKIEIWRAAAYGARALANALPFAVTIAALAFLIQSTLSQPFTLSCKSEPARTRVFVDKTTPNTNATEVEAGSSDEDQEYWAPLNKPEPTPKEQEE